MGRRIARRPSPDQPVLAINGNMVLVAESRNGKIDRRHGAIGPRFRFGVFYRPARVAVLLRELGRLVLPVVRNAAFLDRALFLNRITLLGSGDNRGVDDLTSHGQKAGRAQGLVETGE